MMEGEVISCQPDTVEKLACSTLDDWCGRPAHCHYHPSADGLGVFCKWAEQALKTKPVCSTPSWLPHQFLPQIPTLASLDDGLQAVRCSKPFPPHTDFGYGVLSQQQKPKTWPVSEVVL